MDRFRKEHIYAQNHVDALKGEEVKRAPTLIKYDDGRGNIHPQIPSASGASIQQPAARQQEEDHPNLESFMTEDEALIAKLMQEEADAEIAAKLSQQPEPTAFRYPQPVVSDYD